MARMLQQGYVTELFVLPQVKEDYLNLTLHALIIPQTFVIAVAEKCSKLPDFLQWFKRSKSRPSLTGLGLNSGPKWLGKITKQQKKKQQKKRRS